MYMNNLTEVGNKFDNLTNSTVYILDNSIYNKYDTYLFNISGTMNEKPSFGVGTNSILMINTNTSETKEANCTISEISGMNYTLNCKVDEDFEPDLQSSFSLIGDEYYLSILILQLKQKLILQIVVIIQIKKDILIKVVAD